MDDPILPGKVENDGEGGLRVICPGVGWWSEMPHRGALLGAGSPIGRLERLNRRFRLVLPAGAVGRVVDGLPAGRIVAVEHGQTLFRLARVRADEAGEVLEGAGPAGPLGGPELPPGARAIVAPTDGVFYRRPSPEEPPFVEVGVTLRLGQPIGLVEVMKTFNQILYGGAGFPAEAQVLEIRAGETEEVRAGQILVVVR